MDRFLFERFDACHGLAPQVPIYIDDANSFLVGRRQIAFAEPPRHCGQTGHPYAWLRWHWIVPAHIGGFQVRVSSLRVPSKSLLANCLGKESVRVFTAGFADGVVLELGSVNHGTFMVRGLGDSAGRWATIAATLEEAFRLEANIVVLPELAVTPELRLKVADWLEDHAGHPFALVVPGSFHETRGSDVFNRAEMLGAFGSVVLWHHKLNAFGPNEMREAIRPGNSIELLNTPVGLVAMPICRDFCDEDAFLGNLWQQLSPDWILVPAMGDEKSINAHRRRSDQLCRAHGSACAVANQLPDAKGCDGSDGHGSISAIGRVQLATSEKARVCVRIPVRPKNMK